jgi:hypothetical protein
MFKNKYLNNEGYIVGKGPSLQYLTESFFDNGPIITLNESILKIESFNLSNDIFAMQKDGPGWDLKIRNNCPIKTCNKCPYGMLYPKKAKLLIHKHESEFCLPDYKERYEFDNIKLGLLPDHFSALSAYKLLRYMGCNKIIFISCDSYVNKNIDTYIPNIGVTAKDNGYLLQYDILKKYVDCEIEFKTPMEHA